MAYPYMDLIGLHDGRLMQVHGPMQCVPYPCCVHNPSAHKLRTAPLHWDRVARMMLRRCAHGRYHPDPDDLKVIMWPQERVHNCDGCCEVKGDQ